MRAELYVGDMRERLAALSERSIDAVVTDPPYGLNFMGRSWDRSAVELDPETWRAVLRVAKPGAHMVCFGGSRTFHRIWCAVEDAGWEIRDTMMWLYGSGFPKSSNQQGDWEGWGTGLKPAFEPILLARKPLEGTVPQNLERWGVGALNIDGCRVPGSKPDTTRGAGGQRGRYGPLGAQGRVEDDGQGRWPANVLHDGSDEVVECFPESHGQLVDASSSSSSRKTQNVYGAMNRGNGRDGELSADSENEGAVGFKMKPGARRGDTGSAARFFWCPKASRADRNEGLEGMPKHKRPGVFDDDAYEWKQAGGHVTAAPQENSHPTVKPTDLMRYLCRLICPGGGTVLDPFMGSGSTGKGALLEGMRFVGVELSEEYAGIAEARMRAIDPLFVEVSVR